MTRFDETALEVRLTQFEARLKGLEQNLGSGFTGVHTRLDKMNGAIEENTKFRLEGQWEKAHNKDLRSEFRQWLIIAIATVTLINGVVVVLIR